MILRRMELDDIEKVADIEASNFSLPWSQKSFADALLNENTLYVVAVEDDQIIGYAGAWCVFGEAEITNVCVDESARKRGVGTEIMKYLIEMGRERECDVFFLEVRESNEKAIGLYEKLGFIRIGIRKNFYERPVENAIVMSLMSASESKK